MWLCRADRSAQPSHCLRRAILEQLWSSRSSPRVSTESTCPPRPFSNAAPRSSTTGRSNSHKLARVQPTHAAAVRALTPPRADGALQSHARTPCAGSRRQAGCILTMVQQRSPFGESHNPAAMALLQEWLQSAYVPAASARCPRRAARNRTRGDLLGEAQATDALTHRANHRAEVRA